MNIQRSRSILPSILAGALWCLAGMAMAQVSLAPPGVETPPPEAAKPVSPKPKPKPVAKETVKEAVKKPATAPKPEATPTPAETVTPAPVPDDPNADYVYAAYQRGQYKTAFNLATKRVADKGDPKRSEERRVGKECA